jgi:hypothetical protein
MKNMKSILVLSILVLFSAVTVSAATTLENPTSFRSIQDLVANMLKLMVMVAIPIITLFMVYAGFKFVLAQGNEEELATAKRNFFYVVLGSIFILGAWVFASLLGNTVTELTR